MSPVTPKVRSRCAGARDDLISSYLGVHALRVKNWTVPTGVRRGVTTGARRKIHDDRSPKALRQRNHPTVLENISYCSQRIVLSKETKNVAITFCDAVVSLTVYAVRFYELLFFSEKMALHLHGVRIAVVNLT